MWQWLTWAKCDVSEGAVQCAPPCSTQEEVVCGYAAGRSVLGSAYATGRSDPGADALLAGPLPDLSRFQVEAGPPVPWVLDAVGSAQRVLDFAAGSTGRSRVLLTLAPSSVRADA